VVVIVLSAFAVASCGTSTYQMHAFHLPATSHRTGEVVAIGGHDEIVQLPAEYQKVLVASGLNPDAMPDGSIAFAIVYCCGGPTEKSDAFFFHVAPPMNVEVGDFAEVEMGRTGDHGDPGTVNTLVSVRQKKDATTQVCRWDPPDPNLWERIIYCDWMAQEGGVKQSGIYKTWYKPPGPN